jgi:hypothetical protein
MALKRTHTDGIECTIREDSSSRWAISIIYLDRLASTLKVQESTLDQAKEFADDSVLDNGHRCTPLVQSGKNSEVSWPILTIQDLAACSGCSREILGLWLPFIIANVD